VNRLNTVTCKTMNILWDYRQFEHNICLSYLVFVVDRIDSVKMPNNEVDTTDHLYSLCYNNLKYF